MIWFAIFVLGFILLAGLFVLKHHELSCGSEVACSASRARLSAHIASFEDRLRDKFTVAYVLSIFASLSLSMAHTFARLTAKFAKWIEWRARSVAHKSARAKEGVATARENTFLKEVCDHKECLDTTEVAEANKL